MTVQYLRGAFRESLEVPVVEGERVTPRLIKGLHTVAHQDGKPVKVVLSWEEERDLLADCSRWGIVELNELWDKKVCGIPYEVTREERETNP